jgi:cytochrome c-type biogenesis protein
MDFLLPLFDWLSALLTQSPMIVLTAALLWGVLSVVLSPCHLSAIPLAVGYINGQGKMKTIRALGLSLLFAAGVMVSFAAIGIITSLAGRMLGDTGRLTTIIIGIIFIITGILLFDIIPLPQITFLNTRIKMGGRWGALVLGFLFGAALGPCTFGFMMPVLTTAFQAAVTSLPYAILIVLCFALGHSIVIVFAGTFVNWVQRLLNWSEKSKGLVWFRRVCGVFIIGAGIIIIVSK